jgi:hypothetical protein
MALATDTNDKVDGQFAMLFGLFSARGLSIGSSRLDLCFRSSVLDHGEVMSGLGGLLLTGTSLMGW